MIYKVSTTGTVPEVILNDMGARTLTHPTIELDLGLEYTDVELFCSTDLRSVIENGELVLVYKSDCVFIEQDIERIYNNIDTISGTLQDQIDNSSIGSVSTAVNPLGTLTTNTVVDLTASGRIHSLTVGAAFDLTFTNYLASGNRDLIELYVTDGFAYPTMTICGVTGTSLFESLGTYTVIVRTRNGGITTTVHSIFEG